MASNFALQYLFFFTWCKITACVPTCVKIVGRCPAITNSNEKIQTLCIQRQALTTPQSGKPKRERPLLGQWRKAMCCHGNVMQMYKISTIQVYSGLSVHPIEPGWLPLQLERREERTPPELTLIPAAVASGHLFALVYAGVTITFTLLSPRSYRTSIKDLVFGCRHQCFGVHLFQPSQ